MRFSEPIASFHPNQFRVTVDGGPQDGQEVAVPVTKTGKDSAKMDLRNLLPNQKYRFSVRPGMEDLAGNAITTSTNSSLTGPVDSQAPLIRARLVDMQGCTSVTTSTTTPIIAGTIVESGAIQSFRGGLDDMSVTDYVSVSDTLDEYGDFVLNKARLEQINGGILSQGEHILHLIVEDAQGNSSQLNVPFRFEFPALVVSRQQVNVSAETSQDITVTLPQQTSSPLTVTIQPNNTAIAINNAAAGAAVTTVMHNQTQTSFTIHTLRSGNASVTVSAPGHKPAITNLQIAPAVGADFSLNALPSSQTITWGEQTTYQIGTTPQNFQGSIALAVCDPDQTDSGMHFSFSVNPVPAGGSSILTVQSTEAGTTPGETTIHIRGIDSSSGSSPCSGGSGIGTGPTRDSLDVTIDIRRTQGAFTKLDNLVTTTISRAGTTAELTSLGDQPAVEFTQAGTRITDNVIEAIQWQIAPQGRVGYVQFPAIPVPGQPQSIFRLGMYNLGFERPPAENTIGDQIAQIDGPHLETWFSSDDSLLIVITPGLVSPQGAQQSVALWDMFRGGQISPPRQFLGFVESVNLNANEVLFTFRNATNNQMVTLPGWHID